MTNEQAKRISIIYNKSPVAKSVVRAESESQVTLFLKTGGVIQECKPSRRKNRPTMSSKVTRVTRVS
jgi:hypothetical protein